MNDALVGWIILSFIAGVVFVLLFLFSWSHLRRLALGRVPCPACKEAIQQAALMCPFCRLNLAEGKGRQIMRQMVASISKSYWRQWRLVRALGWSGLACFTIFVGLVWLYNRPPTASPPTAIQPPPPAQVSPGGLTPAERAALDRLRHRPDPGQPKDPPPTDR